MHFDCIATGTCWNWAFGWIACICCTWLSVKHCRTIPVFYHRTWTLWAQMNSQVI